MGLKSHHPLSALFQDYDWADEVLHARIGRDWYLKEFKNAPEGVRLRRSKLVEGCCLAGGNGREQGLTQHRNWWPECYRQACEHWKIEPDAKALAFDTTYEQVRADLKAISASG